MRTADSGVLLPMMCLFADGEHLQVEWREDRENSMPHMPAEFNSSGSALLEPLSAKRTLADFIELSFERVDANHNPRIEELRQMWSAIRNADADEKQFCIAAGRLGVDPYDLTSIDPGLVSFLEGAASEDQDPIFRDLTELAQPEFIIDQWSWLERIREDWNLERTVPSLMIQQATTSSAYESGYALARRVRERLGLSVASGIDSIDSVAGEVLGAAFRFEAENDVPGHGIRAVVGASAKSGDVVAVGPRFPRHDNQRFLEARALYHALVTAAAGGRLVTDSGSWQQRASRAFAAELLAPQQALLTRLHGRRADEQDLDDLARKYEVSALVIEKQLENARAEPILG
jgi:hypothetical protein